MMMLYYFVEIDVRFVFRRMIRVNVDDWLSQVSVGSRFEIFWCSVMSQELKV